MRIPPPVPKQLEHLIGLKGEAFKLDGRVAVAVPPMGNPDAIQWEIGYAYPGTKEFPEWVDVTVNGQPCRINPEICEAPFLRLAECVVIVDTQRDMLPNIEQGTWASITLPPIPHPDAKVFVFARAIFGGILEVVMIDTLERTQKYAVKPANDGQHRHGAARNKRR